MIKSIDTVEIIEQVLNVKVHKDKSLHTEIWVGAIDQATQLLECEISMSVDISPYYVALQGLILQSVSSRFF